MSWIERFDALATLEPPWREKLLAQTQLISAPAGRVLFGAGKAADSLLLLLNGTVRVHQTSPEGREIVLYRVRAGESCVLTTACLLANDTYAAEGVAETDIEAAAIPRTVFDDMLAQSATFRAFVFGAYAQRITELFHVIEDLAFQKIDIRLAQKLLELSAGQHQVRATHAQLAIELGSAREVISRQLQEFQRRGWVETARGQVTLVQPAALQALCAAS